MLAAGRQRLAAGQAQLSAGVVPRRLKGGVFRGGINKDARMAQLRNSDARRSKQLARLL